MPAINRPISSRVVPRAGSACESSPVWMTAMRSLISNS
jgi:hypothetical protein